MKLKKSVKVVLVLLLLGIIGGSFYSFNKWFFTKYKTLGNQLEEQKQDEKKNSVSNPKETKETEEEKEETSIPKNDRIEKKQIKAEEEYFCSDNLRLDGKECVSTMEVDVFTEQVENIVVYRISFNAAEDMELQEKECIEDLQGEVKTDETGVVYCEASVSAMEDGNTYCLDDSYTLKEDKCVKEIRISAKVRYVCPEGYFLDGIYCKEK